MAIQHDDRAAFAPSGHIKLDGRDYCIFPKAVADYAEIKQRIISLRPNPLDEAQERLAKFEGEKDKREFLRACMLENRNRFIVNYEDLSGFFDTLDGQIFLLYLAIRDNDRQSLTLDRVEEMALRAQGDGSLEEALNEIAKVETKGGNSSRGAKKKAPRKKK